MSVARESVASLWFLVGSALLAVSCVKSSDAQVSANQAVQIANVQLTSGDEKPLDLRRYRITVRDRGRTWEVIYSRPGTGGPISTEVEKKSGRIVASRMYQ